MSNGEYMKAKNAFAAAISINPNVPVVYYNRAHCLILYKKFESKTRNVVPPNIMSQVNKSIKSDLHTAIKLDPKLTKYVNKLRSGASHSKIGSIHLKPGENPIKELDQMIGLKGVKREIRQYIFGTKIQSRSNSHLHDTMNLVFEGNPGTGKTQVADLIPKILYQEGVLRRPTFVKVRGSRLLDARYGQSAKNMDEAIQNALGGVLFIDEAYDLMPEKASDEGKKSIITELLQGAENNRGNLIIILAGYPKQMENFLSNSNPGMRSRFNHIIKFPDYNSSELYQIFLLQLLHSHNIVKASDLVYVKKHIKTTLEFIQAKNMPSGNGRLPRQILDFITEMKRSRLADQYSMNYVMAHPKLYHAFTHQDIVKGFKAYCKNENINPDQVTGGDSTAFNPHEDAYSELQHMIGLNNVKAKIKGYINNLRVAKFFGSSNNVDLGSMNMIFEGAPGTGKTQVARLMAKIMYQKGIIKEPKLIECSAKDLVARFVGQTGPKTAKVVKRALGGVLFIDEAYELSSSSNSSGNNNFNAEAVATLIQLMENHRKELLVIMAGYTKPMEDFLNNSNPGLNSRFPNKVFFPNYTAKEMSQIMMLHAKNPKYHCIFTRTSRLKVLLEMNTFMSFVKNNNIPLGNGRDARVILQSIIQARNQRIIKNLDLYTKDKHKAEIVIPNDVENGFETSKRSKRMEG